MKVHSWYDGATLFKVIKRGIRNSHPDFDSTVEFKLKFIINDKVEYSNLNIKPRLGDRRYGFLQLDNEFGRLVNATKTTLDEYKLPALIKRMLGKCEIGGIVECDTSNRPILQSLFGFSEYDFGNSKEDDAIRIMVSIVNITNAPNLKDQIAAHKKERLLNYKTMARKLFQLGKITTALHLYKRISKFFDKRMSTK